MLERPDNFRLSPYVPLARNLVFAGLGFRGSDKSTHYRDSSGRGNHGTLVGTGAQNFWRFDSYLGRWATTFSDDDNGVMVNPFVINGLTSFSMACWISGYTSGVDVPFYAACQNTEPECGLVVLSGTTLRYDATTAGSTITVPSTQGYHHLAVCYNGATKRSYFDGSLVENPNVTGTIASTYNRLYVGRFSAEYNPFNGSVYDPMFWANRALSPSEIQQLADPSNTLLSGLIVPPRRVLWPVAGTAPAAFKAFWANQATQVAS